MLPNTLWAMQPDRLTAMFEQCRLRTDWPTQRQVESHRRAALKKLNKVSGKIAVLPLHGVVEQRASFMSMFFGGTSSDDLGRTIDALMANREVQAIVLDVDSPGGSVPGVQELAAKILGYRGNGKPIYAVSNSLMASAAYWISSAAEQIIASPGSETGSIGVIGFHVDMSEAMKADGLTVTAIRSGKYKAEGNPFEPLSSEAKDYIQGQWDQTYGQFLSAVAKGRGKGVAEVRSKFGEGRTMLAEQAKAVGMIDQIATLDELVAKLSGAASATGKRAETNTTAMRLRHEQAKRRA